MLKTTKPTWPKIQKSFFSFLEKDEKISVKSANENKVEGINKGALFGQGFEISSDMKTTDSSFMNTYSPFKKELFLRFQQDVILQESGIYKGQNNTQRNWLFNIRSFLLQSHNTNLIFDAFWEIYKDQYPFQLCGETVAGGILAQLLSLKAQEKGVNINCFLIRQERKTTGLQNIFEGHIAKDIPVVLCDDLFNTGDTIAYSIQVLKRYQIPIHSLFCFVQYESEQGKNFLQQRHLTLHAFFPLQAFGIIKNTSNWTTKELFTKASWSFQAQEPNYGYSVPKSSPCQDNEKIFFGTHSSYFYALNKNDGSLAWKFKTGEHIQKKSILSSPLIHENKVIFGSYDGNLYALDTQTGKEIWKFCDAEWIGSSPTLSKKHNIIFIGMEYGIPTRRGGISAVNAQTGEKLWEDFFEDYVHCSPSYSEELDVVIIGSNCGKVRLYDATTGQKYWGLNVGKEVKMSFAFYEEKGIVSFGAFDGKEYIVDVMTGKVLKTIQTGDIIYSSPLIHQDILYFTSTDKKLYAFDLQKRKLIAEFLTGGRIISSPVVWKDFIIFGSNDARVYFINFERKECYFLQFTERMTNKVLFDEERCYVHLYNNEVQCFLLEDIENMIIN